MPRRGEIYLGTYGSELLITAFGRKLSITPEQIVREGRTASGKLVRDIVATKQKILLRYDLIDGKDLTVFQNIYDLGGTKSIKIYTTETVNDQYYVLMDPIEHTREIISRNDILWSGVQIVLKEV